MTQFIPSDLLPFVDHSAALRLAAELHMEFDGFDINDYIRTASPDDSTANHSKPWSRRTAYNQLRKKIANLSAGDGTNTQPVIQWPLPETFNPEHGTKLWRSREGNLATIIRKAKDALAEYNNLGPKAREAVLRNRHTTLAGITYWIGHWFAGQESSLVNPRRAIMLRAMEHGSWCDPTPYGEREQTPGKGGWGHIVGPLQLFYHNLCIQAGGKSLESYAAEKMAASGRRTLHDNFDLIPEVEVLQHILPAEFYGMPADRPDDFAYYRKYIRSICRLTRLPRLPHGPVKGYNNRIPEWLPLPRRLTEEQMNGRAMLSRICEAVSKHDNEDLNVLDVLSRISRKGEVEWSVPDAWDFALFSQRVLGLISWAFLDCEKDLPHARWIKDPFRIQVHLPQSLKVPGKWGVESRIVKWILPIHQGLIHSVAARNLWPGSRHSFP